MSRGLEHVAEGRARVEGARAEGVGGRDERGGVVAAHDRRHVVRHRPLREPAALLRINDERLHHVARFARREQSVELDDSAVRVPVGEVRVLRVRARVVNRTVEADVFAVHIGEDVRVQERVVERGVEDAPLVVGAALDAHTSEPVVPRCAALAPHGVEVPSVILGPKVEPRILNADE